MKHTTVSLYTTIQQGRAEYDASQTGGCGARMHFSPHIFTSPAQLLSNSVFVTPGSKFTVRPSSTFTSNVTPLSLGFWWAPETHRHQHVIKSPGASLVTSRCWSLSNHISALLVRNCYKHQVIIQPYSGSYSGVLVRHCYNNESSSNYTATFLARH